MTDRSGRGRAGSLTLAGYRLGALLSRTVPSALTDLVASGIGTPAAVIGVDKRRMADRHMARVVPQASPTRRRRMTAEVFDNYARYYLESFRLPSISADDVSRAFTIDGFENVTNALDTGRGALVALSSEDHYTRIRTTRGEELVLIRLADAIREAEPVKGLQVHRSHWVALDHIAAARRDGDRAILRLSIGSDIPVSRANVARLREAGLLPR